MQELIKLNSKACQYKQNKLMKKDFDKKQTFPTQTDPNTLTYDRFLKQVKNYSQNLNNHLEDALNDQRKCINRKRIELQKNLKHLKEKYYYQRQRIREMEDFYLKNCQSVLKNDIEKWEEHRTFFAKMLQNYQYEVEIQTLINTRNRQKILLLKQQLKQLMKLNLQPGFSERLQFKNEEKATHFRTKKLISINSQKSINKIRTQVSQFTLPNDFQQNDLSSKIKTHTQVDQKQNIPSSKIIRVKTQVSLPQLNKFSFLDPQTVKKDSFHFMKAIGASKKQNQQCSILPQMINFLKQHYKKVEQKNYQIDWFEKVVFNKRNFQKIIKHLQQEFDLISGKKKMKESSNNKVKDLVAKNFFRLKTESTFCTNQSLINQKCRKILHNSDKKPFSNFK